MSYFAFTTGLRGRCNSCPEFLRLCRPFLQHACAANRAARATRNACRRRRANAPSAAFPHAGWFRQPTRALPCRRHLPPAGATNRSNTRPRANRLCSCRGCFALVGTACCFGHMYSLVGHSGHSWPCQVCPFLAEPAAHSSAGVSSLNIGDVRALSAWCWCMLRR